MKKIPTELREDMSTDPFYQKCCLSYLGNCNGKVEWHHALIYAGSQVNEKYAILPACHSHHGRVSEFNENFVYIALQRATDDELRRISKAVDYIALKKRLHVKYDKH